MKLNLDAFHFEVNGTVFRSDWLTSIALNQSYRKPPQAPIVELEVETKQKIDVNPFLGKNVNDIRVTLNKIDIGNLEEIKEQGDTALLIIKLTDKGHFYFLETVKNNETNS